MSHHEAQHVAALLGSHLGRLEIRDDVRITTDRDGVRVEMYRHGDDSADDVRIAVADFIHGNGFIAASTAEFVIGTVADTTVTVNVSPRLALLTPIRGNIA